MGKLKLRAERKPTQIHKVNVKSMLEFKLGCLLAQHLSINPHQIASQCTHKV
jgi:hypothetical protein